MTSTTSSKVAAGSFQHGFQIVEGKLYLLCEIGLGRTVFAAADLAGDEEKITGADRCRIAVDLIERLPAGGER